MLGCHREFQYNTASASIRHKSVILCWYIGAASFSRIWHNSLQKDSMTITTLLLLIVASAVGTYLLGKSRARRQAASLGGIHHLSALPLYYGTQAALWCALPCIALLGIWVAFDDTLIRHWVLGQLPASELAGKDIGFVTNKIENLASGVISTDGQSPALISAANTLANYQDISQLALSVIVICALILGSAWGWLRVKPTLKSRVEVERIFMLALLVCACIAVLTTVGIVMSVLRESLKFFAEVPLTDFIFGLDWNPQTAIRKDQVAASGSFGAIPLFTGTLLISSIAMVVAVPTGLMAAIYLSEYASPRLRAWVKPLLEILAGIPTVVYGFFAAITVAPFIRSMLDDATLNLILFQLGPLEVNGESALAAGLVMGVMIIPFVSSLSDDVINAVPQALRNGSYGLGATQSETVKQVILPAALPGIVGGILLAVSRAIGETMIVVMAASLAANLTANPLESVTTVTVQIKALLTGDQEFETAKTLSAFALGLVLFATTLALNFVALRIVKKYREQYE